MDTIAQQYIELAHDIERLDPGYIDGYYGDEKWKGAGGRTLEEMAEAVQGLRDAVPTLHDRERRTFLTAQVSAMQTKIGLLRGEPIRYTSEVRGLYDIEPVRLSESEFDASIALLNELLPGEGEIAEREQQFRKQFVVDPDKLTLLLDVIIDELRQRTTHLVTLPEGDGFETRMVKNEPWSAYNWYLGDYQSRVDINTDLPIYLVGLPDLIAHEAYPGHHTEHALKEKLLWHIAERGEHSILLINAPECVVSEGIATRARRIVMSDADLADWLETDLAPIAGLTGVPIREMLAIFKAKRHMRAVTNNAAILLHEDGATDEEAIAYIQRYRLASEQEARKSLSFIKHPNFRSYGFTYTVGADLLDELFEKKGTPHEWFKRLLTEPITPGVVREWIAA
jgi:hypothetical protein